MAKMTKKITLAVFCGLVLTLAFFQTPTPSYGLEIMIQVSPSTLNIQSMGEVVTVHTSIAYSSVVGGSVTLNGLEIEWWKSDNQGNFVAKFVMTEVKELVDTGALTVPGENELKLVGITNDGEIFTGTQTITVINVQPTGTGKK